MIKTLIANGITWKYRPGIVYTGTYRGYDISIRFSPPPQQWRLYVSKNQGGSLAFHDQFHETVKEARQVAKDLIDERLALACLREHAGRLDEIIKKLERHVKNEDQ